MIRPPLRSLVAGLIDYAGLFPPAALGMGAAVEKFTAHRQSRHALILSRFVVPVARLEEFAQARTKVRDSSRWGLSVLIGGDPDGDRTRIDAFVSEHGHLASVESAEYRPASFQEIGYASATLAGVETFFEIPHAEDPAPWMAAVRATQSTGGTLRGAKIRTGGVTPELIPSSAEVARFMTAARDAGVAFKATAGLHHPLRGEYPLTYEKDAPTAVMHGYLNVFLAAAALHAGRLDREGAERLLDETDPSSFRLGRRGVTWRGREIPELGLAAARDRFALSYGSCSFDEPVDELKDMGWLDRR
ncbi:MAG: hypothetical protein MPN21_09910 [Thermoanaerobaculia bacterium]|nr:hypothetical protein [Thermoanaerobaculia bacterium]